MNEQINNPTQNPELLEQTATRKGIPVMAAIPIALLAVMGGFMAGRMTAPQSTSNTPPTEAVNTQPTESVLPTEIPESTQAATPTDRTSATAPGTSPTTAVKLAVSIPSDWKPYTLSNSQYKYRTTLSLPPGYVFHIVGSGDMTIQNEADATEIWDYTTSKFNGPQGVRNYYDGSSRRAWYQGFLNGNYASPEEYEKKRGDILTVTEVPIGSTSYLDMKVKMTTGKTERQFIFVQNGILHIFRPMSEVAYTDNAKIPAFMGTVLASLKSVETQ